MEHREALNLTLEQAKAMNNLETYEACETTLHICNHQGMSMQKRGKKDIVLNTVALVL